MKKLILIDGNALVHRSYHALPPLVSPDGILVNGVYGFTLVFLKILRDLHPDYVVATFDMAGPTFRHQEYKEYKATRKKMPDNFYEQIEIVHQLLRAFSVPIFEKQGYEADDVIGTIVQKVKKDNLKVFILTGDLDTLQLVDKKVNVLTPHQGLRDQIIYTPEKVEERFHLPPRQLRDWKALRGDPSDNVPGIPSIGEKTAQKLISQYHDLDTLYQNIKEGKKINVSPRILEKLKKFEKQAYFSRHLVTIQLNVPLQFKLEEAKYTSPQKEKLVPLLEKLGFTSLIPKIFAPLSKANSKTEKISPKKIEIVSSSQLEEKLKKGVKKAKRIGFLLDYEGERLGERKIKGLGIALPHNDLFYLPFSFFSSFFEKGIFDGKQLVVFEAKIIWEELNFFSDYLLEDVKILAWLLDSSRRNYNLSALGEFFLKKTGDNSFSSNLDFLLPLEKVIKAKLLALNLEKVWEDIEQPLIPILASMEKEGVLVDKEQLRKLTEENEQTIANLQKNIYKLAGRKFNINSPSQLRTILFQVLKLPSSGLKKTPGGKISLDNQVLQQIKKIHPLLPLIIHYREVEKLRNSFLEKLPHFIDPQTGRIHTIWNQTGTATGRLSSEKPNLQNVPQKIGGKSKIRNVFQATPGFLFLSLDYSQIELRLAAHLSGDLAMIKVFEMGKDIHTITASYVNDIPEEQVTPLMRKQAKALNFGILYGMGDKSFAAQANIPLAKAKQFREEYFNTFPGLKRYLDYSKERAKQLGYAETIFGRKRFLPLIEARGRLGREQERIAINMPIQGLAADIIKMAMKQIQDWIEEHHYQRKARILIQIHDELILEVKSAIIEAVSRAAKDIMENIVKLNVPLVVKVKRGKNWGEV